MNLFTNFLDVWPTYENSDKTVEIGDRVTLMEGDLGVTGTLDEIAFHVSGDSGILFVDLTAVVIDEHWNLCEKHEPYFFLEEAE